MRDFVSALKGKNGDAFRTVQLSSRAEGNYSNRQIASRIAECKVGAGQTAEELLGWLTVSDNGGHSLAWLRWREAGMRGWMRLVSLWCHQDVSMRVLWGKVVIASAS